MINYKNDSTFSRKSFKCSLAEVEDKDINYKNMPVYLPFLSKRGRIMPTRITGISHSKQRLLAKAVKQARFLALVPYQKRPSSPISQ